MNKKIFITGEAKIVSLLRNYISAKMEAEFETAQDMMAEDNKRQFLKKADVIILLHEIGRSDESSAEKNLLFTKEIIQSLPKYGNKATVVYFAPRKNLGDSDEVRAMKFEGEQLVQNYCAISGAKAVLYRMPELYGQGFENAILDRLIKKNNTEKPDSSYEFLHTTDFFRELYRMVNGAPALMGYGRFAHPAGSYFSTEAELLKKFASFKKLSKNEIPDFPSPFERHLYDYYLLKSKQSGSCEIKDDVLLSSVRFGKLSAIRLMSGEKERVTLNGAAGLRLLLLCGEVKINRKVYCANNSILRIDLSEDADVKNAGEGIAVIQIWNHT